MMVCTNQNLRRKPEVWMIGHYPSPVPTLRTLGAAVAGYLFGTIPSADFAARMASGGTIDLRTRGTGNPGAANAIKVLGPGWGYGVMAADISKAAASVVGHCFPVWNGFRGGKGVGCSVGQCLMTFPAYVPIDLALAALTTTRRWKSRAYAAALVASSAWVGGAVVWWWRRWPNAWGPKPTVDLPLAAAASSAVILYRFASARPPVTGEQP
jgi:glycerol-3-phosphate acyltransferase PlsY